jgi:hypothetical protein
MPQAIPVAEISPEKFANEMLRRFGLKEGFFEFLNLVVDETR